MNNLKAIFKVNINNPVHFRWDLTVCLYTRAVLVGVSDSQFWMELKILGELLNSLGLATSQTQAVRIPGDNTQATVFFKTPQMILVCSKIQHH
jgi:hypothetical protein